MAAEAPATPGQDGLVEAVGHFLAAAPDAPGGSGLTGLSRAMAAAAPAEPASDDKMALSKQTQNPISSLISVPFQDNIGFNAGPNQDKTNNILNIQPVYPLELTPDWNLIARAIIPLVYQPSFGPGSGSEFGFSDIQLQFFFVPAKPGKIIWGVGPLLNLPTATDSVLGPGEWGMGMGAVALAMPGRWVAGALVTNVWGLNDTNDLNQFLFQYFINYNLEDGWSLTMGPSITANWNADSDNRWTVPVGGGVAKIFRIGKQAMKGSVVGYANVERPDGAPEAVLQIQLAFLFPKGKK